jgi:hypothetical protein
MSLVPFVFEKKGMLSVFLYLFYKTDIKQLSTVFLPCLSSYIISWVAVVIIDPFLVVIFPKIPDDSNEK